MFSRTPVAVTAGTDFVVEGAVDLFESCVARAETVSRALGQDCVKGNLFWWGGGKRTLSCSVPKILARYEAMMKLCCLRW